MEPLVAGEQEYGWVALLGIVKMIQDGVLPNPEDPLTK